MTAQFPDTIELDGEEYAIAGVQGAGLFHPFEHGLNPWRGSPLVGEAMSATTRWPAIDSSLRDLKSPRLTLRRRSLGSNPSWVKALCWERGTKA
ncbi:MAG: hypothetical protein ACRDG5_11750 [Anaerolineales bacterium]